MAVVHTALALALVLSHVALFPAILYSYWRRLFVETALLIAVLVASTAFHVCQVGWFCFGLDLHALQLSDHFMVYTALLWFALYFAGAAERARTAITIAAMAIVLPVIATFIGSWMSGAIIVAMVLVLATLVLVGGYFAHGGPPIAWGSLLFAMLSLFYILDIPYKDESMAHTWITVGDRARVAYSKRRRRNNSRVAPKSAPRRSKMIKLPKMNFADDGVVMMI